MNEHRPKLTRVRIAGFKSFDAQGAELKPGTITALIGANGAGKSNLVAMLRWLGYLGEASLMTYVQRHGGADAFMHNGTRATSTASLEIETQQPGKRTIYRASQTTTIDQNLIFNGETLEYWRDGKTKPATRTIPLRGHESGLPDDANKMAKVMLEQIRRIKCYQFHDTSEQSPMVKYWNIDDGQYLRHHGGNLAPFLRSIRNTPEHHKYYQRIVRHVCRILPQFKDFELEPSRDRNGELRLNWYSHDSEHLFAPYQLSDGSLRFIALATLLLQPPDCLPNVIVIDEPELGLHPAALAELIGMIHIAAEHCQVILATQSAAIVDALEPDQIAIVERDAQRCASVIRRLDPESLDAWLETYSLSELWEKNLLGGQP